MLNRVNRLPSYAKLIRPRIISSPYFLLKTAVNEREVRRFGFIISKKTAGRAVDRNRSKRLIRACVEGIIDGFPPGRDYLFIIRKNLIDIKKADIETEIKKALLGCA